MTTTTPTTIDFDLVLRSTNTDLVLNVLVADDIRLPIVDRSAMTDPGGTADLVVGLRDALRACATNYLAAAVNLED